MQVKRIGSTVDQLGESCVWSVADQKLYWVDVRGPSVRRFHPLTGRTETAALPELVGAVAHSGDGTVLVAMESCIATFDFETGKLNPVAQPSDRFENLRFNDARVDRQGRLWAGTMDDVGRGEVGSIYRLDRDLGLHRAYFPITIPNSLAFSPDGLTMYLSDTVSREIWAFDFDPMEGVPANRRVFARVPGPGTPDGSTVDSEGYLWNAEYDGWRIVRYAPDGCVDTIVEMPVQRPTCCTFGGPDLDTLFVTTAAQKLTAEDLAQQPLAGGLLALKPGVRGIADPACLA